MSEIKALTTDTVMLHQRSYHAPSDPRNCRFITLPLALRGKRPDLDQLPITGTPITTGWKA